MARYLFLWVVVRVAGRLPLAVLDPMAILGGAAAWWLSRHVREVTRDHMRHALGATASHTAIDRAARECIRSVARAYVEFAQLPYLTPEAVRARIVETDGMEALTEANNEGRGVVLISAHLGAPEMISRSAPTFGIDLACVSEPLHPQRVHDLVHGVRTTPGVQYFPATLAGLRDSRAHVAAGKVLGVLIDRDVLGTGRPFVFFGERALMPTGAVEIVQRTGAAVVTVWCYRIGAGRYRLVGRRIDLPPATGNREADVAAGMRIALAALEDAIRAAPGQWLPLSPVWRGLVTPPRETTPATPVQ